VGQCASNVDTLKEAEAAGKNIYDSTKKKIDGVSEVLFEKPDSNNPGGEPKNTGGGESDGHLSPGGKNPSACTTATSSSRNSLKGSEAPPIPENPEPPKEESPEDNLTPA